MGLLEGLEVSEIALSKLERTLRFDAEFFRKEHLAIQQQLGHVACKTIVDIAKVSDGNHFAISDDFADEGIPYYRGQDVVGNFFVEQAAPNHISESAFHQPLMARSHLKRGDVLLSIIGTIGEASLVSANSDATCSCKLAILRPKAIDSAYLACFLRSRFGRSQIERFTRGAVQMGLLLEDMDQISVPSISPCLEEKIRACVSAAKKLLDRAEQELKRGDDSLLTALSLNAWQPPTPLTYTQSSTNTFAAGRLDAEYFRPRVRELLAILGGDGYTIGDLAPARSERFTPASSGSFDYLEIGGIRMDGTAQAESVLHTEAPSRATNYVRSGDVITSTVRPIRRLSALIAPEQDGFVCSSGFVVLQPKKVAPEVLLTYLRLPVVCELMDLHTSASLYPAISEQDLLSLPMPLVDAPTSDAICAAVKSSQASRQRATELLEAAKRAVEIAIEDSEAAALAYLNEIHQGTGGH